MIHADGVRYVKVDGSEHPFKIGMREHQLMYRNAITIDASVDDLKGMSQEEAESKISVDLNSVIQRVVTDFDTFLEMFELASKKGCRLHEKETGEAITPLESTEIEDAIDSEPMLYDKLMGVFVDSNKAEGGTKKKPKNP